MTEKSFVDQLEKIFANEGFLTKKELGVGYGVADLVLLKIDPKKTALRYENKQFKPLLNESYFKVFQYLPDIKEKKEPISINKLIRKTELSDSFLKYKILKKLKKDKYIIEKGNNLYYKVNGWVPLAKEIIAIEAKLKDWKRGFYQANRYKAFADKTYLAIPSNISHLVNRDMLRKHNVGLITLDVDANKKRTLIVPKKKNPLNADKRNFAVEFFWTPNLKKKLLTNI